MAPKSSCHTSENRRPKRRHNFFKVIQQCNDRTRQEAMNPAIILPTTNMLARGQSAQPLPQKTTFQLCKLALPKYLSLKKRTEEKNRLIMLFIANPLDPFKHRSMGLQKNFNTCKIVKITDQLLVRDVIYIRLLTIFQVPASCNINLTKDNYLINIPTRVLIMSLSYIQTSGGSPLPPKLNVKSPHWHSKSFTKVLLNLSFLFRLICFQAQLLLHCSHNPCSFPPSRLPLLMLLSFLRTHSLLPYLLVKSLYYFRSP